MGNLRKKGREDMGFWELVVLAVGLSMDAFAVSICKGLALQRVSWKECCIAGAWCMCWPQWAQPGKCCLYKGKLWKRLPKW